jgi:hypothetical protein
MTIIKIYMFSIMFCCNFLMFVKDKENIFKSMVIMSLWFISFSILCIIKEIGY